MPFFPARASMRQQSGRGDRLDPQDLAFGSQQSGLGAPQNTPNNGSPNNGSPARRFQDADEEDVPGFVVPGNFENSVTEGCYVKIRFDHLLRRHDLDVTGIRARAARVNVGRDWADNLPVTVRFRGLDPIQVRYRPS